MPKTKKPPSLANINQPHPHQPQGLNATIFPWETPQNRFLLVDFFQQYFQQEQDYKD